MKQKRTFNFQGRVWLCSYDPLSTYWTATSENPTMRICEASWKLLQQTLKTVDTSKPRIDAVAVCESLSMNAEAKLA